jgi:hypothetical protein
MLVVSERVQNTYESAIKKHSAAPVSEEARRSIEETVYLTSIPGMKESIIAGMQEEIEDCAPNVEW